jgi:predicted small secreted protein
VKKTFKLIGTIVLIAVIAFSMAACDSGFGSDGGNTGSVDSRLNGTWVVEIPRDDGIYEGIINFNKGNYEVTTTLYFDVPWQKGTYTTTGNSITITPTHYRGDSPMFFQNGIWLEPKFYSSADLRALGVPESSELVLAFSPRTTTYSISGNTLYITGDGYTEVYTKR